jgi:diamine N-acetyltransferase
LKKTSPERPTIYLRSVTGAIRSQVAALQLAPGQQDLVASNSASLIEAEDDMDAQPRAIFAGNNLVGFLMYDATSDAPAAQLYRFMIDCAFQGRGYGKAAVQAVIAEIRALDNIQHITICYEPENIAAKQLYLRSGFIEQGLDEDGEMIAILEL